MLVGVIRGLQMMADYLTLLFALMDTHPEAMPEFKGVFLVWLGETCNLKGIVKVSAWSLIMNGDPWKGSRQAWRELEAKWGPKR